MPEAWLTRSGIIAASMFGGLLVGGVLEAGAPPFVSVPLALCSGGVAWLLTRSMTRGVEVPRRSRLRVWDCVGAACAFVVVGILLHDSRGVTDVQLVAVFAAAIVTGAAMLALSLGRLGRVGHAVVFVVLCACAVPTFSVRGVGFVLAALPWLVGALPASSRVARRSVAV